jgi:hypothetical protein
VTSRPTRWALYAGLIVLYLFHNDIWLWGNPTIVLGLPVSLLYHVVYCLVVAVLMALVVRFAWPYSDRREP